MSAKSTPPRPCRRRVIGAGTVTTVTAALLAAVPQLFHTVSYAAEVQLTSSDATASALGGGTALVMGPTFTPTPPQSYLDLVDALYLQPNGFTGITEALTTPEQLFGQSRIVGAQILTAAIQQQIAGGDVSADNPVVVFGYSQSSALSGLTMQQLADAGVPSDLVHFILVGDGAAPSLGRLTLFDSFPATPVNLYPTDVYTLEYDGGADVPRYPINLLSDLNSYMGIFTEHLQYLNINVDQVTNAILLPGSADLTGEGMANFYMMPAEILPLLSPLLLLPLIGQPLYDLLEPATRILVNLGYGSITDGWYPGPANVVTPVGLFPTDLDWSAVPGALNDAVQQGIQNAISDIVALF